MALLETLTVGGGCFWCLEAVFQRVEGVEQVVSGYAGGDTDDPSYREVCSGETGHAEVVQVTFDPDLVTTEELLELFFAIHDPTQLNRQGPDVGSQYRSIILWNDDGQKAFSEEMIRQLNQSDDYRDEIVTEISELETFYPAEEKHQDYYQKHPNQPYCQSMIPPKLKKALRWDSSKIEDPTA